MTNKDLPKEITQQNATEIEKPFEPTPAMEKWLEASFELGHTAFITDVSKEAKVDRTNWYLWLKDIKFVEWWDLQWQKHLRVNRWKLDAIGMKKAEESYDFWKSMMNRTGNTIPEGPTTATQVNIELPSWAKE